MKINTRIDKCFQSLRAADEKGFIAYITAGDPDIETTYNNVLLLENAGVDVVELGIPFSDPLADGRVNQESAQRALESGTTILKIFDMISRLRKQTDIPLMCYCYMNLLYAPGFERMLHRGAKAGLDGMLILDLPVEERPAFAPIMLRENINDIALITPTSPTERIQKIVRHASGFVYVVSRAGVTGMQESLATDAKGLLSRARRCTSLPLALGFGISNPAQARDAAHIADAVVVGSAIVQQLHEAGSSRSERDKVKRQVRKMVKAVKEVS